MAMDAIEANQMASVAKVHSHLVAQIVPRFVFFFVFSKMYSFLFSCQKSNDSEI